MREHSFFFFFIFLSVYKYYTLLTTKKVDFARIQRSQGSVYIPSSFKIALLVGYFCEFRSFILNAKSIYSQIAYYSDNQLIIK